MERVDLRSDTVTLPSRGDARGHGRRAGRRRPVRRRPVGQSAAGQGRRAARQGGGAVRAERHDGQPDRAQAADAARRRGHRRAGSAHASGTNPARGGANCGRPVHASRAAAALFTAADFRARVQAARPHRVSADRLVAIENTHNRGGGVVFPQAEASAICAAARGLGVARYLDGARLFNAASLATGARWRAVAAPFDLVSVALSKGLGCPVGSLVAGPARTIAQAVRARRMFGGAMRQSGILAAAGLYALDHNRARLTRTTPTRA